jgi:hypothetical protein
MDLVNLKYSQRSLNSKKLNSLQWKKKQSQKTKLRLMDASSDQVSWILIPIDGKANPSSFCGDIPPFKYLCFPTATGFGRGRTRVGHAIRLRVDYKSQRS